MIVLLITTVVPLHEMSTPDDVPPQFEGVGMGVGVGLVGGGKSSSRMLIAMEVPKLKVRVQHNEHELRPI